jgi:hypothetical protein
MRSWGRVLASLSFFGIALPALGGCASAGHVKASAAQAPAPTRASTSTTDVPPTTALRRSDADLLERDNLALTSLGAGWTMVGDTADEYPSSESLCAPGSVLPRLNARVMREFSFDLDANGDEAGHLRVELLSSPTDRDLTQRVHAVQDRPDFRSCIEHGVVETMQQSLGGRGTIASVSTTALAIAGFRDAHGYRTTLEYDLDGVHHVGYVDTIATPVGRALVSVEFNRCCNPWPETYEHDVVATVARDVGRDFAAHV